MQYYKLTKDGMVLRRWGITPGRYVPNGYLEEYEGPDLPTSF